MLSLWIVKQLDQEILSYYVKAHSIRAVTLIPYDIYGPNDWRGRLTLALWRAAAGKTIDMTPGEQLLDFVHVSDVINAYILAQKLIDDGMIGNHGEHFFLGSGRRQTLKEIASS